MNLFFFVSACAAAGFGWLCWREYRLDVHRRTWAEGRARAQLALDKARANAEQAAVTQAAEWVGAMRDQLDEIHSLETVEPKRTIR